MIYIYIICIYIYIYLSGWWFGTCFHILGIIIPTDFHIFRGVETTNQIYNIYTHSDGLLFLLTNSIWIVRYCYYLYHNIAKTQDPWKKWTRLISTLFCCNVNIGQWSPPPSPPPQLDSSTELSWGQTCAWDLVLVTNCELKRNIYILRKLLRLVLPNKLLTWKRTYTYWEIVCTLVLHFI